MRRALLTLCPRPSLSPRRPDRGVGVDRGAGGGVERTGVRHVGHPRHPVPADPADAARRPPGRHVEAARVRRVHTQTGQECIYYTRSRRGSFFLSLFINPGLKLDLYNMTIRHRGVA